MHSAVKLTHKNAMDALIERVPEFKAIYDEDLALNNDEVLLHGLFEELFTLTQEAFEAGNIVLFARIVDFINLAAMSDDEVLLNPVEVSFMERVPESSLETAVLPLLNAAAMQIYENTVNRYTSESNEM